MGPSNLPPLLFANLAMGNSFSLPLFSEKSSQVLSGSPYSRKHLGLHPRNTQGCSPSDTFLKRRVCLVYFIMRSGITFPRILLSLELRNKPCFNALAESCHLNNINSSASFFESTQPKAQKLKAKHPISHVKLLLLFAVEFQRKMCFFPSNLRRYHTGI